MWQSALLAAIVGFMTITGTLVGHRWQAAESTKVRVEQYRREDQYRLFRDRLEAYGAFHEAVSTKARPAMISYQKANRNHSLESTVQQAATDAFNAFIVVRLIGDGNVVLAASRIMREVNEIVWRGNKDFDSDRWSNLILDFVCAARKDLIMQDGSSSEWIVFGTIASGPQLRRHAEPDEIRGAAPYKDRVV